MAELSWILLSMGVLIPDQGFTRGTDGTPNAVEFLVAREKLWKKNFPVILRFREFGDRNLGPVSMRGIWHGKRIRVESTRHEPGVEPEEALGSVGLYQNLLIGSGERYLGVQRGFMPGVGPNIAEDREWAGTLSDRCPDRGWLRSMMHSMHRPIEGQSVEDYLQTHPPVEVQELDDSIVVHMAPSIEFGEVLRSENRDSVMGFLGLAVTFSRRADWRPTLIQFCLAASNLDVPKAEWVEGLSFAGVGAVVERSLRWGEWKEVGGVRVPATFEHQLHGRVEGGRFVRADMRLRSWLEVEFLEELPPGVSFALIPPASAGPLGKISDLDSGEVTVYDARGPQALLLAREEEVARGVEELATGVPREAPLDSPFWGRRLLLVAGAALLGLGLGRLLLRRRSSQGSG